MGKMAIILEAIPLFFVILAALGLLQGVVHATTFNMNYGECLTDSVSEHEYCAPDTQKYNINISTTFDQVYHHVQSNITVNAPKFPAINQFVNLTSQVEYRHPDSRYNFTAFCTAPGLEVCKENIDITLDYGEDYYSGRCNIHIRSHELPQMNDTRTLQPGEIVGNAELAFLYTCYNSTPELLTYKADIILLNDTIRQISENTTRLYGVMNEINQTYQNLDTQMKDKEHQLSVATARLTGQEMGKEDVDDWYFVGGALIVGALAAWFYKGRGAKTPPTAPSQDPQEHELNSIKETFRSMGEQMGKLGEKKGEN